MVSALGSRLMWCGEGLLLAGLGHPVQVLLQHIEDKSSKEPPPLRLIESSALMSSTEGQVETMRNQDVGRRNVISSSILFTSLAA